MDVDAVNDAVRQLRSRGERVSVRAVHAITGGSFRDLSRLLRDSAEFLADDEDEIDAEAEDLHDLPARTPPPALGAIVEAFQAAQAAEREAGEAGSVLNAKREQLRAALADRPPPATDPRLVSEAATARLEHEALIALLREEIGQLEKIVATAQAEALTHRIARERLVMRARELRGMVPGLQRDVRVAREHLGRVERDFQHELGVAQRNIAAKDRTLERVEGELRALQGEQG